MKEIVERAIVGAMPFVNIASLALLLEWDLGIWKWTLFLLYFLTNSYLLGGTDLSLENLGLGFTRSALILIGLSLMLHSTPYSHLVLPTHFALSLVLSIWITRTSEGFRWSSGSRLWYVGVLVPALLSLVPVIWASMGDFAPAGLGDAFYRVGEGYAIHLGGIELAMRRVPDIYPIGYSSAVSTIVALIQPTPAELINMMLSLGPLYFVALYFNIASLLRWLGVKRRDLAVKSFLFAVTLSFAAPFAFLVHTEARGFFYFLERLFMDVVLSPKYRIYVALQYQLGMIFGIFSLNSLMRSTSQKERKWIAYLAALAWVSGTLAMAVHVIDLLPLLAGLSAVIAFGKLRREHLMTFPLFYIPYIRPINFNTYGRIYAAAVTNELPFGPVILSPTFGMILPLVIVSVAMLGGLILRILGERIAVNSKKAISALFWLSFALNMLFLAQPSLLPPRLYSLAYLFPTMGAASLLYMFPPNGANDPRRSMIGLTVLLTILVGLFIRPDISPVIMSLLLPVAFVDNFDRLRGLVYVAVVLALISPFAWHARTFEFLDDDWAKLTRSDEALAAYLHGKPGRTLLTCTDHLWKVGFFANAELIPRGMNTQIPKLSSRDYRPMMEFILTTDDRDALLSLFRTMGVRRVVLGECLTEDWLYELPNVRSWEDVPEAAAIRELAKSAVRLHGNLIVELGEMEGGRILKLPLYFLSDAKFENASLEGFGYGPARLLRGRAVSIPGLGMGRVEVGETVPLLLWRIQGDRLWLNLSVNLDEFPPPTEEDKRDVMLVLRKGELLLDKIFLIYDNESGLGWVNFTLSLRDFTFDLESDFAGYLHNSSVSSSYRDFVNSPSPLSVGVASWHGPRKLDEFILPAEEFENGMISLDRFDIHIDGVVSTIYVYNGRESLRLENVSMEGELTCVTAPYSCMCEGDIDLRPKLRKWPSNIEYVLSEIREFPADVRAMAALIEITVAVASLRLLEIGRRWREREGRTPWEEVG